MARREPLGVVHQTDTVDTDARPTADSGQGRSLWSRAWRRLLRKRIAVGAMIILGVLYLSGILAPFLSPYDYNAQDFSTRNEAPSLAHPFGTDWLGRDQFTRVMWGLRTTVIITVTSVLSGALPLGLLIGTISGYKGGRLDNIVMRIGEIFLAFPGLLLIILLAATVKPRVVDMARALEDWGNFRGLVASGFPDYLVVFGSLAAFAWVGMARLVRSQVLYLRQSQFVDSARAAGASTWRIMLVHILPNSLGPVIVSVSMGMGAAAGSEVVLSWLGIGIQPPNPSLGRMLYEYGSISILRQYPHLIIFPAAAVSILIFAWNLLGDALNDVFNPRTR